MSRSPSFSLRSEFAASEVDEISLKQWVVAFCIIRFDLEQGQLIEECYPPGCLTQNEELEVSFNSFPDSVSQHHNRSSIHDCIFFFRIRRHRIPQVSSMSSSSEIVEVDNNNNNNNNNNKKLTGTDGQKGKNPITYNSRFLYGFVFNRQRHDERLKRGGEQKSVVILSHCPYTSVFRPLLQIMGPLYFDIGSKALNYIAAYVSKWPTPVPGQQVELPIGNASLKVNLPPSHSLPSDSGIFEDSASSLAPLLPSNLSIPQGLFHDSDLFGTFRGLLMQLWKLWELLLVGEPILIIAPTPPQCCEAVSGLVSLVAPLLFSVDFRPYFTIHDPEFAKLNSLQEGASFPPMILGVTNLFFLKALRRMPHIISVGNPTNRFAIGSKGLGGGGIPGQQEGQQLSLRKFSPANFLNAVKMRRDGPLCLMTEHKEAVWTNYGAVTKPDTSILNRLIDAGMSPRVEESMSVVNNDILRRHFLELTTNFLAPFGPYFRANTPSEASSPFADPPPLPTFNAEEFLISLSARGPGKFLLKRMRSNWLDLYRKFLRGYNFLPWFRRKRAVAEQEQYKLWRQARVKTDIQQLIGRLSELEIVDSFNAIQRHLLGELQYGRANEDTEAVCMKLKKDLQAVFNVLPKDMQQLLIMKPESASLLEGSNECSDLPQSNNLTDIVVSATSLR
ncbi:PREDICTED: protein DENND6A [Erythranthe guttata]|uniref:protein DENND6A n=1 Tax=Erythranthe guttata TaxID=4155 RepID=UPI00064DE4A6|nr:PREDICTED: protein DENND6A [Erythranthe guttata]|eukprot:XP_012827693.1 PREDICTED: protein DENND6A [Erythranthe guttata]